MIIIIIVMIIILEYVNKSFCTPSKIPEGFMLTDVQTNDYGINASKLASNVFTCLYQ